MTIRVSVVIPVYNGALLLSRCLRALETQSLPRNEYEVIVVDDGSTDATVSVAKKFNVRLISIPHQGEAAARNAGVRDANGKWIAYTDDDCVPTRTWLSALLDAVNQGGDGKVLGSAGPMIGYESNTTPARFIDLTEGLDTEIHLSHPTFPYAPLGNVMYLREALLAVGGVDERYKHYPAPELHDRLLRLFGGEFNFVARAVVFHRHRATWRAFWKQQLGYGIGYAQFLLHHNDQFPWSVRQEIQAWGIVAKSTFAAALPGSDKPAVIRRGNFVKQLAQRVGFLKTYWNAEERRKWQVAG